MMMSFPMQAADMPVLSATTGVRRYAASLFILILSALLITPVKAMTAETWIPASDDVVLADLPASNSPLWRAIRTWRSTLEKQPDNQQAAAALARAYLELRRVTGDPRYLGYAQAALAPWWQQAKPPADILLVRARLKQTQHQFSAATKDLQQLLMQQPRNTQAWLLLASVAMVQGNYELARSACAQLLFQAAPLVSTSCVAQLGSMTGKLDASYELLKNRLQASSKKTDTLVQWTSTLLAEMAVRRGDMQAAKQHFEQALSAGQPDIYLISAYADYLLATEQAEKVIALLDDRRQVDPLLLRLAIAMKALNMPETGTAIKQLQRRFDAMRRRGDDTHLREDARFMLELQNNPEQALKFAQGNWRQQHEIVDALLLARAALVTGDIAAAKPVLEWQQKNNVEGVQLTALLAELQERGL
ncbi:MAG TPA: tetratricopeptide repeat protein, partial [Gammaproteobacteria bacterium]|nr:tetratricopeptide repeat protein [Gammaproteobacteria bacterium]